MKTPLSWIKRHLETNASLEEISHKLTSLGLVVDGIDHPGEALKGFRIAQILETAPHPDADRLKVCQVDTGDGVIQVVCGASNARAGLKTVLGRPGMTVPSNGMVLKQAQIRGVDSFGMMCSTNELCLEGDASGIIELPEAAPVGMEYADYLGLNDPVIDLDVTPNRGDCFAMRGVARDLAASGMGVLKPFESPPVASVDVSAVSVSIDLDNAHTAFCPHFAGRVIRGVKNGPSPQWLQQRLQSVGLRSISTLVDITNFMAFDLARPMHVFDVAKLKGNLTIRMAKEGENLKALDERTYALTPEMLVIADDSGPVSLAGIMGGLDSGCDLDTTDVFLESAYFEPICIARTGQKLSIISDSRMRFERGVDPALVLSGLDAATAMILEICGGHASDVVQAGAELDRRRTVPFRVDRMASYGGLPTTADVVTDFLQKLGCEVSGTQDQNVLNVVTPSWRHDLAQENDLIEEVLRLQGYDAIEPCLVPCLQEAQPFESVPGSHDRMRREWIGRRALSAGGMSEAVTWSFISHEEAQLFGGGDPGLILDNPISQDMSTMRPSLVPNLVKAAARNMARGHVGPALFEVGSQYEGRDMSAQKHMITGVRAGKTGVRQWRETVREVSVFDVKADVVTLLEGFGLDTAKLTVQSVGALDTYHPGRSGVFYLGKQVLAYFGELHPRVVKALNSDGIVAAFEVFLENCPPLTKTAAKRPLKLSNLQGVERDLAFILDKDVSSQSVMQAVVKVDKELITEVGVFDVYEGTGVPQGKKSLGIRYRLSPKEATLTDEQINALMYQVIASVEAATGGVLRS